MKFRRRYNIDKKIWDERAKNTKYCKRCGHSIVFKYKTKRIICSHCGYWVYNSRVDEFKDKILERKRKLENES